MFFTNEPTFPFRNLKDVLKKVPEWTLLSINGTEQVFKLPAMQGDQDFANYWQLLIENPERYQVQTIEEGLARLEADKTVLFSTSVMLSGSFRQNPKSFPSLSTFGETKSTYNALILTKNSPLTVFFRHQALKCFEQGQNERLSNYWFGSTKNIPKFQGQNLDTLVLSHGQVLLIFVILFGAFLGSGLVLLFELAMSYWKRHHASFFIS